MEKKAQISENLQKNLTLIVVVVIFASMLSFYIADTKNAAETWSEYYSKEISGMINLASPGDIIEIEIEEISKIARNNRLSTLSEIFDFNNEKNEICIKLSRNIKSCNYYFNNVDITEINPKLSIGRNEKNSLSFKVVEKLK